MFCFVLIFFQYEEVTVLLTWAAIFHDILCDKHSLMDILTTKLTKVKTPKFIGITRVTCLQAVIAVI